MVEVVFTRDGKDKAVRADGEGALTKPRAFLRQFGALLLVTTTRFQPRGNQTGKHKKDSNV